MSSYLFAGILLLVLAGGFFIYWKVKRTARRVSKALFGTEDWEEGMRKRRLEESLTPRSVSGMTSVYLPQIKKDFPEFDWPEFRARSQNLLASFLKAVSSQELSLLNGASSEILDQARLWISDLKSQEIEELFQDIKIHRTEILGYTKKKGPAPLPYKPPCNICTIREGMGRSCQALKNIWNSPGTIWSSSMSRMRTRQQERAQPWDLPVPSAVHPLPGWARPSANTAALLLRG